MPAMRSGMSFPKLTPAGHQFRLAVDGDRASIGIEPDSGLSECDGQFIHLFRQNRYQKLYPDWC